MAKDTEFIWLRQNLWEHLQRCVERRVSPQLINPADVPGEWLAQPVELYRWAVAARLDIPEELDALLSFISTDGNTGFMAQPKRIQRARVNRVLILPRIPGQWHGSRCYR
ncbi:MAG: hypothetical protein U5P41_10210 [Gammaproteobacteria bacterium]|nr:hypothetical protein [Gammaproteobacteria bacterium]